MGKSGDTAFSYAKAAGLLSKSFINKKSSELFEVKNLSDLWTLLFSSQVPALPETLLAQEIEKKSFHIFLSQYTSLISQFEKPVDILTDQLLFYEAENLKQIVAALFSKKQFLPSVIDIGEYSTLNYSAWPDLQKITENSIFSWLQKLEDIHQQQEIEYKIDLQVVHHLWKSINKTSGEDKKALSDFYIEKYTIKNVVWALRLKKYYKMNNDEIINHLIYVDDARDKNDVIASEALKILNKDIDNYDEWKSWKYLSLLNPYAAGDVWQVSPDWIERAEIIRMNTLAKKMFHINNVSLAALVGWFYMKDFELNCIRTAVEALRLNIPAEEAEKAVGISGFEKE